MPFARLRRWLDAVPIRGTMDRRNALFLQILLLLVGIDVLVTFAVESSRSQFDPDLLVAMALRYALVGVPALIAIALIRRGRLITAARLFLGVWLFATVASYVETGLQALPTDFAPCFLMAIGAHLLGARALWGIFAAVVAGVLGAILTDQWRIGGDSALLAEGLLDGASRMALYLATAVVLDRTIISLRNAMNVSAALESHLKEVNGQLQEVNGQLQGEIDRHLAVQQQLVHALRVESAGRIASGVAHDFGNVLSIISGYAGQREQLADQGTDALVQALQGIELAAQRAHDLNRRLLDFTRREELRCECFDAAAAIRASQPLLVQALGRGVRFELALPADPLPIVFDRTQFDLISINLASNARDAMAGDGAFAIHARRVDDWVELRYVDTGKGVARAELERFFEPFYTSKPRGCGTGLGLAVVRDLVERAGGSAQARSRIGEGTALVLRLPVSRDGCLARTPPARGFTARAGGPAHASGTATMA